MKDILRVLDNIQKSISNNFVEYEETIKITNKGNLVAKLDLKEEILTLYDSGLKFMGIKTEIKYLVENCKRENYIINFA